MADLTPYNLRKNTKPSLRAREAKETDDEQKQTETEVPMEESPTRTSTTSEEEDSCEESPTTRTPLTPESHTETPPLPTLQSELLQQMERMFARVNEQIAGVKDHMNTQIAGVNDQMKTQNDQMKTQNDQMKTQNDQMKTQNDQIAGVNDQIAGLNIKIDNRYTETRRQIADLKDSMQEIKNDIMQTRRELKEEIQKEIVMAVDHAKGDLKNELQRIEGQQAKIQVEMTERITSLKDETMTQIERSQNEIESNIRLQIEQVETNFTQKQNQNQDEVHKLTQATVQRSEQRLTGIIQNLTDGQNEKIGQCVLEIEKLNDKTVECHGRIEKLERIQKNTTLDAYPEIHVTCNGGGPNNELTIPRFSGRAHNPSEFLERLKKYHHRQEVRNQHKGSDNREMLIDTIEQCLDQHASRWWQLAKSDVNTWSDFETIFLRKYWSVDVQKGIRRKIEIERYRPGGRLTRSEYFIERVLTLNSMSPKITEEEVVTILSEHFSELIQDARRVQNTCTVRDFEGLLQREDIQESARDTKDRNQTPTKTDGPRREQRQAPAEPKTKGSQPYFPRSREDYRAYPSREHERVNYQNNHYYQQRHPHGQPQNKPPNYQNQYGNQNRYRPYQYQNNKMEPTRDRPYPTQEQNNVCHMIAEEEQNRNENSSPANQRALSPHLNG